MEIIKKFRWHLLVAELAAAVIVLLLVANLLTQVVLNLAVASCISKAQTLDAVSASCGVALTIINMEAVTRLEPQG